MPDNIDLFSLIQLLSPFIAMYVMLKNFSKSTKTEHVDNATKEATRDFMIQNLTGLMNDMKEDRKKCRAEHESEIRSLRDNMQELRSEYRLLISDASENKKSLEAVHRRLDSLIKLIDEREVRLNVEETLRGR